MLETQLPKFHDKAEEITWLKTEIARLREKLFQYIGTGTGTSALGDDQEEYSNVSKCSQCTQTTRGAPDDERCWEETYLFSKTDTGSTLYDDDIESCDTRLNKGAYKAGKR